MEEVKKDFMENEIWKLTIQGAFQHNKIYDDNTKDKQKERFRNWLHDEVKEIITQKYENNENRALIKSEDHSKQIKDLQELINQKHNLLLSGGKIKLGIIQKLFNLYLKYRWCLEENFPEPPHCPFDSIIIDKLKKNYDKDLENWTGIEYEHEYERIVNAAKKAKRDCKYNSIAEWELRTYEDNREKEKEKLLQRDNPTNSS